jgi:hypothetical protein
LLKGADNGRSDVPVRESVGRTLRLGRVKSAEKGTLPPYQVAAGSNGAGAQPMAALLAEELKSL